MCALCCGLVVPLLTCPGTVQAQLLVLRQQYVELLRTSESQRWPALQLLQTEITPRVQQLVAMQRQTPDASAATSATREAWKVSQRL